MGSGFGCALRVSGSDYRAWCVDACRVSELNHQHVSGIYGAGFLTGVFNAGSRALGAHKAIMEHPHMSKAK